MALIFKSEKDVAAAAKAEKAAQIEAEARAYLLETDWYANRLAETKTPIPADVAAKRKAARAML